MKKKDKILFVHVEEEEMGGGEGDMTSRTIIKKILTSIGIRTLPP